MKILSFNIREIYRDLGTTEYNWKFRMKAMNNMLKDINPDIICFQEMTFPANLFIPKGYKRVGLSVSHPIYIRKEFKYSKHKFRIHEESALITINENFSFTIINIHSHWNKKTLNNTIKYIKSFENTPYIACGDFNNTASEINDYSLSYENNIRVVGNYPEKDTFINFTKPEESHGEIDHFYSNFVLDTSFSYKIIEDTYSSLTRISDHYPILLEF